jgi:hypothetical protein
MRFSARPRTIQSPLRRRRRELTKVLRVRYSDLVNNIVEGIAKRQKLKPETFIEYR